MTEVSFAEAVRSFTLHSGNYSRWKNFVDHLYVFMPGNYKSFSSFLTKDIYAGLTPGRWEAYTFDEVKTMIFKKYPNPQSTTHFVTRLFPYSLDNYSSLLIYHCWLAEGTLKFDGTIGKREEDVLPDVPSDKSNDTSASNLQYLHACEMFNMLNKKLGKPPVVVPLQSWASVIVNSLIPAILPHIMVSKKDDPATAIAALQIALLKVDQQFANKKVRRVATKMRNMLASIRLMKKNVPYDWDEWSDWTLPQDDDEDFGFLEQEGNFLHGPFDDMEAITKIMVKYFNKCRDFVNWTIDQFTREYELEKKGKPNFVPPLRGQGTSWQEWMVELEDKFSVLQSSYAPVGKVFLLEMSKRMPMENTCSVALQNMQSLNDRLRTVQNVVKMKGRGKLSDLTGIKEDNNWVSNVIQLLAENWSQIMVVITGLAKMFNLDITLPDFNFDSKDVVNTMRDLVKMQVFSENAISTLEKVAMDKGYEVDYTPSPYAPVFADDGLPNPAVVLVEEKLNQVALLLEKICTLQPGVVLTNEVLRLVEAVKKVEVLIPANADLEPRAIGALISTVHTLEENVNMITAQVTALNSTSGYLSREMSSVNSNLQKNINEIVNIQQRLQILEQQKGQGGSDILAITDLQQKFMRIQNQLVNFESISARVNALGDIYATTAAMQGLAEQVNMIRERLLRLTNLDISTSLERIGERIRNLERIDVSDILASFKEVKSRLQSLENFNFPDLFGRLIRLESLPTLTKDFHGVLNKFVEEFPIVRTQVAKCIQYINQWGNTKTFEGSFSPIDEVSRVYAKGQNWETSKVQPTVDFYNKCLNFERWDILFTILGVKLASVAKFKSMYPAVADWILREQHERYFSWQLFDTVFSLSGKGGVAGNNDTIVDEIYHEALDFFEEDFDEEFCAPEGEMNVNDEEVFEDTVDLESPESQRWKTITVGLRAASIPHKEELSETLGYHVGKKRLWLTWAEVWKVSNTQWYEEWKVFRHPNVEYTGPWDRYRIPFERSLARVQNDVKVNGQGFLDATGAEVSCIGPGEAMVNATQVAHVGFADEALPVEQAKQDVFFKVDGEVILRDMAESVFSNLHPNVCVMDSGRIKLDLTAISGQIVWKKRVALIPKMKGPFIGMIHNYGTLKGSITLNTKMNLSPLCGVGFVLVYFENGFVSPTTVSKFDVYSRPHACWNPACQDACVFSFHPNSCVGTWHPNLVSLHSGEIALIQVSNWLSPPSNPVHMSWSLSFNPNDVTHEQHVCPLKIPSNLWYKKYIGQLEFIVNDTAPLRTVAISLGSPTIATTGLIYNFWQSLFSMYSHWAGDVVIEVFRLSSPMVSMTMGVALCVGSRVDKISPDFLQSIPHVEFSFGAKECAKVIRFPRHLVGYMTTNDKFDMVSGPTALTPLTMIFWSIDSPTSSNEKSFVVDVSIVAIENVVVNGFCAGQVPRNERTLQTYVSKIASFFSAGKETLAKKSGLELSYVYPMLDKTKPFVAQNSPVWFHVCAWWYKKRAAIVNPEGDIADEEMFIVDAYRPHVYRATFEDNIAIVYSSFVRFMYSSNWFKGTLIYKVVWVSAKRIKNSEWSGNIKVALHSEHALSSKQNMLVSSAKCGMFEFSVDVVGPVDGFYGLDFPLEYEKAPAMFVVQISSPEQYEFVEIYGSFAGNCVACGAGNCIIGDKVPGGRNFDINRM